MQSKSLACLHRTNFSLLKLVVSMVNKDVSGSCVLGGECCLVTDNTQGLSPCVCVCVWCWVVGVCVWLWVRVGGAFREPAERAPPARSLSHLLSPFSERPPLS